ncbi:hypothetical protein HPB51_008287 [Rhipicephalus microplus]|uniref:Homeobox domain-containing protein n=1 Tax=Rhipicephalus microplus TaxID=6941 RepID=A0A9J6EYT3_RHIMP|nr:hypothetical protein HPB51_008287 [Rhipicephalus microplus]
MLNGLLYNGLSLWRAQVWFQNRRAKWKKRKKTSSVFRNPGALLPSHSLPPFGSVGDATAGLTFGSASDPGGPPRWAPHASMPQMGHLGPALARQPPLGPPTSVPTIAQHLCLSQASSEADVAPPPPDDNIKSPYQASPVFSRCFSVGRFVSPGTKYTAYFAYEGAITIPSQTTATKTVVLAKQCTQPMKRRRASSRRAARRGSHRFSWDERMVGSRGKGSVNETVTLQACSDMIGKEDNAAKEIVDSPSVSPVDVSEGVKAFPWAVETKYYTATIYLHTTSASVVDYDDSAENIHGLIVLFNPNQKDTLEQADKWIDKCRCDVVLLVCGRCPSAAEPQGKQQQVLEWCVERSCELIETQPNDEDDEEDATGVRRIVEALHAHPWPQLEMKGKENHKHLSVNLTKKFFIAASTDLKLFSEAMATDGDDVSFEELFAKFKDMKVQADKLSGEERKKFAEKVAIQFWRAFGGEEDEVCGLSSEDEAEK